MLLLQEREWSIPWLATGPFLWTWSWSWRSWRGRGNDRGNHHNTWINPNIQKKNGIKAKNQHEKTTNGDICHRCGMSGHWSRTCRTAQYLVKLHQASLKAKGKEVETNFVEAGISDNTHIDASDFFQSIENDDKDLPELPLQFASLIRFRPIAYHKFSPLQLVSGREPNISHLKVFGCAVYVPIPPPQRSKMGPQRRLGIYVGFESPSIIKYLEPVTGDQFTASPAKNVPARLEVPEVTLTQTKASKSQIRRKRGRPLGSKDANPRKRKDHIVSINHDANVTTSNASEDKIPEVILSEDPNLVDATTLRFLISLSVIEQLKMQLMDVVTAYLYGSLDTNIYMRIPEGLKMPEALKSKPRHMYSIKLKSGTAISWRSTKQTLVATLSNHAELIALYEVGRECVWLRSLIHYVYESCGLEPIEKSPTVIYEDNATCIAQIKDGYIKGNRTKHISPKFFSTHELQVEGKVDVKQIPSSQNLADLFTKALPTKSKDEYEAISHIRGALRWNSTYLMLKAAICFKRAFDFYEDVDLAYKVDF
ncbi:UNVERIFIED_CONTAM: hypothetical protein Scaly_0269200 [Sesamum calycinum]|uniref:CCHC-type domain-containing protein n=1 Tax=Sesamum calycinum TaxID=2727403 RepID=A0AAW2S9D7_9LAMI